MSAETDTQHDAGADEQARPENYIHIVWRLSRLTSAVTGRSPLTLCKLPMRPEYWKQGDDDHRLICEVCFRRFKSLGDLVRLGRQ